MDLLAIVAASLVFLAVSVAALALRPGDHSQATVERLRSGRTQTPNQAGWGMPLALRQARFSRIPLFNRLLSATPIAERLALELDRADVPLRVGEYMLLRLATAAILGAIGYLAFSMLLVALPLAGAGLLLPAWYIAHLRRRRLRKIGDQLEEMITIVSGSLKSGYGFLQSMEFAAQQLPPPIADELHRTLRDANVGTSIDDALADLLERVPLYELDLVITAIGIQRTVGGNLAEILDNVGFTMRERRRIFGEIRTLTAQQRLSAYIISLLPVGLGLLFTAMNPDYMSLLFTRTLGLFMIGGAVVMQLIGIFIIRRIVAIEV